MNIKLIEKYQGNYKLRALVSLVPNIGGALDILLSEKGSKWREKRLFDFLSKLETKIENLETDVSIKALTDLANSEETYDLLIQAFNSIISTRHSQKISCYANVLINHIINPQVNKYSSELMLSVLDSLTLEEIEYASALFNTNKEIITHKIFGIEVDWEKCKEKIQKTSNPPNSKDEISEDCKFPFSLSLIWKLLSDKNIVLINKKEGFEYLEFEFGNSMHMTTKSITSTVQTQYELSEFGKEFVNWILEE